VIFITQWVYIYSHLHASFCDFPTRTQACIFAHASLKYITCSSSIYRYIDYRVVPIVIVADNTIIDEKVVYLVLFFVILCSWRICHRHCVTLLYYPLFV
jgi:hypothetical protein